MAKIICQRSNCVYDYSIRKSFSNAILLILIVTLLSLVIIGFIKGLTLQNFFLSVVFPCLPGIILLFKQLKNNAAAQKSSHNLKAIVEDVWGKTLKSEDQNINHIARKLQDKIFLNRKNSPLVFDWYYDIKRNQLEKEMYYSVKQLVKEYKKRQTT